MRKPDDSLAMDFETSFSTEARLLPARSALMFVLIRIVILLPG
jgi:hypothetical protein